jgi:hypothetical protein
MLDIEKLIEEIDKELSQLRNLDHDSKRLEECLNQAIKKFKNKKMEVNQIVKQEIAQKT